MEDFGGTCSVPPPSVRLTAPGRCQWAREAGRRAVGLLDWASTAVSKEGGTPSHETVSPLEAR